jgi:tyrosine-protein kinase
LAEAGLTHYLHVLRRNLWVIILVIAIAVGTTVYVSGRQAKVYRSSADVFLGSQTIASALSNVATQSDPLRDVSTQANLARTNDVARRALKLAGLTRSPASLLANSSVSPAPNADILTFSVQDHSPALASRLAGDYALAYTRFRHYLDTAAIHQALKDIGQRLDQLRQSGLDKTNAYADLLDKQQQFSTLEVLQSSNALLVRPGGEAAQIEPRPVRNAGIALVLALLLGVGLAFLREALNTRVRATSEVQQHLGLPLLGRIAEPPRRYRRGDRVVMLDEPYSPGAEGFRIIATNLDLANLECGARTIMFTSATHSEGKSTTIANLAVAFARSGRRVVLLDLDLRRPVIDKMFRLSGKVGLTTVVLGREQLEDALVPIPLGDTARHADPTMNGSADGRLEVLTVGILPPNPAEIVGSHALGAILEALRDRADLVLIDAPPLLNLSDGMTLAARVEGLVVVARLPLMRRSLLQELHRVLTASPVAKLGFVATGTSDPDSYGYDQYYGGAKDAPAAWESASR